MTSPYSSSQSTSLNAGSYSVPDLVKIIDQNETNDSEVIRSNLSYYQRKYAHDPQYARFFADVHRIFLQHGILKADEITYPQLSGHEKINAATNEKGSSPRQPSPSANPNQSDVFDVSQYSIEELGSALNYDLMDPEKKPDLMRLKMDRKAYLKRVEPTKDDAEEEIVNKRRATEFFKGAFDMITAYLYPKYGGLASMTSRYMASAESSTAYIENDNDMTLNSRDDDDYENERKHKKTKDDEIGAALTTVSSQMKSKPTAASKYGGMFVPSDGGKKRHKTTTINVDTRFRRDYFDKSNGEVTSTSEISFSLDERIKNVRKVSIASLEYPNSAYAISSNLKSNIFYIQVIKNGYQTSDNAGGLTLPTGVTLPSNTTPQHYITHEGEHKSTTGGPLGTYRVSLMSGNYNKDTLVATVNIALRTLDISSGLAAVMAEFNTSYNKFVLRKIDMSSSDATSASSIFYPGVSVIYESRTYRGANSTAGLVTSVTQDFRYNVFFELYESLDGSGNYDLTKPTIGRPLFFNAGWVLGFRKERYLYSQDYILTIVQQATRDDLTTASTEQAFFLGYNAESPYDVNSMRYFYICLTDYVTTGGSHYMQGVRNDNNFVQTMYGMPNDVIARIVNNGPKLHYTFFDRADFINKSRVYEVPVTLQNFKIRITDEYGRLLDLNSMDWSAAIEVVSELD